MSSNTKTGSASKIKMESFDDLFGGSSAQEIGAEQIINAPLCFSLFKTGSLSKSIFNAH